MPDTGSAQSVKKQSDDLEADPFKQRRKKVSYEEGTNGRNREGVGGKERKTDFSPC